MADEIARRSITLIRNGRDLLPLLGTRSARVLSVTYRRTSDVLAGRYFNQRLRPTYPRLATAELDRDASAALYEGLLRQARRSALVVVSTYVTAVSYSGTVAVPEEVSGFIEELASAGIPHVVVSFGNPYLITEFPDVQAYMLAWSGSQASQRAAAGALFGDFPIQGRTPTRIPGFADIGDGIQIPQKTMIGGTIDDRSHEREARRAPPDRRPGARRLRGRPDAPARRPRPRRGDGWSARSPP